VSGLPTLAASRDLALSFQDMMRRRAAGELESWLERASASGLSYFVSFARGLRADRNVPGDQPHGAVRLLYAALHLSVLILKSDHLHELTSLRPGVAAF